MQHKQAEKVHEIRAMVDEKLNFADMEGHTPEDEQVGLFTLQVTIRTIYILLARS